MKKLRFLFLLAAIVVFPFTINAGTILAGDYGDGSAGEVIINSSQYLSSFPNKNFMNLTIDNGGTLIIDQDAVIHVLQNLRIKNGGRIISTNGTNGNYQYSYYYEMNIPYDPTTGRDIVIKAANIDIYSTGSIVSGNGGIGYPGYSSGTYMWGPGYGARGGNIDLYCEVITLDNALITTGNGGNGGNNPVYRHNSGGGGSSGRISILSNSIEISNQTCLQTGTGGNGQYAWSVMYGDGGSVVTGGPAGNSGDLFLEGVNLTLDATSRLTTGSPGNPGPGRGSTGYSLEGANAGAAGSSGKIQISNFSHVHIHGLVQTGQGGAGSYSTSRYSGYPGGGTAGGDAGEVFVSGADTLLHISATGRILGGTGGTGGTPIAADAAYGGGGLGGLGGSIALDLRTLHLENGSLIASGTGGNGGNGYQNTHSTNVSGGHGGAGGNITLNIREGIVKPDEINIKTGSGGNGGHWSGYYYYDGINYYYRYTAGSGGKGGNAVVSLPQTIAEIEYHLLEIGGGGSGQQVTCNYGMSSGNVYCNYIPGKGGDTGDLTINTTTDLSLSGEKIFTFASPGTGNIWTTDSSVRSQNGSTGNCTINIGGELHMPVNNAIYFADMVHSGFTATNNSHLTINCNNLNIAAPRPIKWGDLPGGSLTVATDLRQMRYSHDSLASYLKDQGQAINTYVYKFTYDNVADLFRDIPDAGFQASQDISFALDERIYHNFLHLFTNVRRYKSEDGGTNWEEITYGEMTQSWIWHAPATIKGNGRLKIGVTPYGYAQGITEIWFNGVKMNTYWTPSNLNPPAIWSYNYTVLDGDVGIPEVALVVNDNQPVTEDPVLELDITAIDNLTPSADLKYYVFHNNNLGNEIIASDSVNSYQYDLSKYYADGLVPTGYYRITVKVLDESFNTGIASKTIYYLRPVEKPILPIESTPEKPEGYILKDWTGAEILQTTQYEGLWAYIVKKNSAEMDMSNCLYPFYQVKVGDNNYNEIICKDIKHKLRLPPGEGIHFIGIRYCNSDKVPGYEQEFVIIVDQTPPEFAVQTGGNISATKNDFVSLEISAWDNITSEEKLEYSFDRICWDVIPQNGRITKSPLNNGLNRITVYVRDESGNIGEASCRIWKL